MSTTTTTVESADLPHRCIRGNDTCLYIISTKIARKYKIDNPDQITVQAVKNGIVIRC